ncbi:hypothetical protein MASR2M12_24480 [Bacteroidales bacterium]
MSSFHYLGRGDGYFFDSNENASYCDLRGTTKIFFAGNEIHLDHPVINHIALNTRYKENIELVLVTKNPKSSFSKKVDRVIAVENYYYFIKAVNHYLVSNGLQNQALHQSTHRRLGGIPQPAHGVRLRGLARSGRN